MANEDDIDAAADALLLEIQGIDGKLPAGARTLRGLGVTDTESQAVILDFLVTARKIHDTYDAGDAALAYMAEADRDAKKCLEEAGVSRRDARMALAIAARLVRSPDEDEDGWSIEKG